MKLSTIDKIEIKSSYYEFKYQRCLTDELDNYSNSFDQEHFNKIVLWKTNRFAILEKYVSKLINEINPLASSLDVKLTSDVLKALLKTHGVRLPLASTVMRFRNPQIYQILDQRVYRILYGKELRLKNPKTKCYLESSVKMYLEYLFQLREVCSRLEIPFNNADRILYLADQDVNSDFAIKY